MKSCIIGLIKAILLTLGVTFISLGVHTSELQYSFVGGICLGFYEIIKDD